MKKLVGILFLFLPLALLAQVCAVGSGGGVTGWDVRDLQVDSTTNKLYLIGRFLNVDGVDAHSIAVWDGERWDSLSENKGDGFWGLVSAEMYNGELILSGGVWDSTLSGIAKYNNTDGWRTFFGDGLDFDGIIWKIKAMDDDLYIGGDFDTIDNVYAPKLARWDGTQWHSYPDIDNGTGSISAMAVYKDELYVGGDFDSHIHHQMKDVAKWDGSSWQKVGRGLSGALTHINDMLVWKDTLYMCGIFEYTTAQGPGNSVAKWDGTRWHHMGNGNGLGPANVDELIIYRGEMYACGQISSSGDTVLSGLARWDAEIQHWRPLPFTLDNRVTCMEVYNDELYFAGGFNYINGDIYANGVAKYKPESGVTAIGLPPNLQSLENTIQVYPNPVSELLSVKFLREIENSAIISLIDIKGAVVYKANYENETSVQLDVKNYETGVYLLQVDAGNETYTKKIVVD